jgi:hypothetical protein
MNKTAHAVRTPRARMPAGPARRGRLAAAAIIAVLAVVVAAALATGVLVGHAVGRMHRPGPPPRPGQASGAPVSTAPAASTAAPAPGPGPGVIPAHGTLQLITGSHLVNGIYTDYPRSLAGAVSLAVEVVTEIGSTLEPDRAATIARLTASSGYQAAAQEAAVGALAARHAVGLRPAAAVPPGTAVLTVPVMYQVRDTSHSQLTVLLLFEYTQVTSVGITDHTGVTAVRLGWTPDSWRLLPPAAGPGPASTALIATPGTAAAAAHGWKAMTDAL